MFLKPVQLRWWWRLALVGLAMVWTIWLSDKISQATNFEAVIGWVWLAGVGSVPLVTLGLRGLDAAIFHLRPRSLDEHLMEVQQRLQRDEERASKKGQREAERNRATRKGQISLGPVIRGGYLPKWVGMAIDSHQWLTMDEPILNEHILVIGATGAGKTVLLTQLISEILTASDRDIYLIDGKGDLEWSLMLSNYLYQARKIPVPIFSFGHEQFESAIYNGFAGSKGPIYERLFAMVSHDGASADAEHYREQDRDILQLICGIDSDLVQPPDSFQAVRQRLSKRWMEDAYQDQPEELAAIDELNDKQLNTLSTRMRILSRSFGRLVGPEGFCLGEVPAAIFSLKVSSAGDTAKRFLKFLIEDVKDFSGNVVRQRNHEGIIAIDEWGAFGNQNIILLLQQARSAGLSVILATQDVASLGDELQREKILNNCRTKILMATDFPQAVAELAGTISRLESSLQHTEGEATGLGSAREQETFLVHPNEVRALQTGQAFVIRRRHSVLVQVKKPKTPNHDPNAVAKVPRRAPTNHVAPIPTQDRLL